MLRYNESENVVRLSKIAPSLRVSFALLAACRLLPAYRRFHQKTGRGDPDAVEGMANRLWRDIDGDQMSSRDISDAVTRCTQLVPTEDDGWDEETQSAAEDAVAAMAYAFRTRQTSDAQEAAWAARRAYEAIDRHITSAMDDVEVDEFDVVAHPLMQAELARQERDLNELTELDRIGIAKLRLPMLRVRCEQEAGELFSALNDVR